MASLVQKRLLGTEDNVVRIGAFESHAEPFREKDVLTLPSGIGDLITGAQIRLAKAIARSIGSDADNVAEDLFGYSLTELSRTTAEDLIEYLQLSKEQYQAAALSLAS